MPKMLIVTMENAYPFDHTNHATVTNEAPHVVRQTIPIKNNQKTQILAKATFVKNLKNRNLVKIQSILEEQNSVHLLYEFIESKTEWMKYNNIAAQVYEQIKNLTNYLINIGVKASIQKHKIGVNQHNFMKYFLGLDFVWDSTDDDTFLVNYYQAELNKIFGSQICRRSPIAPTTGYEMVPLSQWQQSAIQKRQCHDRKVSIATLPTQYDRFLRIDKQLNQIKSSSKDFSNSKPNYIKSFVRSQSQESSFVRTLAKPNSPNRLNKKYQDRKYSGDLKFTMFASKKLFEKESDIKSQRGFRLAVNKFHDRRFQQNPQEEIETVNSKSRIQEMKYQQYLQITKSNKSYLSDFLSVLEDEPSTCHGLNQECKSIQFDYKKNCNRSKYGQNHNQSTTRQNTSTDICVWKSAEQLQRRAQEAIKNSLHAIKKFRSIPT